jgi:putative membrane protein
MLAIVAGAAVMHFQFPYAGLAILVIGLLLYYLGIPRIARSLGDSPTRIRVRDIIARRQRLAYVSGLVLLAVLESWPTLEMARYVSSLFYLSHNLLIVLGAVPLMLIGIPNWVIYKATQSTYMDSLVYLLTSPIVATILYSGLLVALMFPPVVQAQAHSAFVFVYLQVLLTIVGVIMWLPAMRLTPGVRKLTTGARVIYLFAQSLLPSFPAFVLIFAHHSFYPIFAAHVKAVLGISEIGDQQLAGGISKVITLGILWSTAIAILSRAERKEEVGVDPEPITWLDVEREFKRYRRPLDKKTQEQ